MMVARKIVIFFLICLLTLVLFYPLIENYILAIPISSPSPNSRSSSVVEISSVNIISNKYKFSVLPDRDPTTSTISGQTVSSSISEEFQRMSEFVQKRLDDLQKTTDCDGPNIICHHHSNCGFGCQVHHRVICLVLSFVTNRPLIQDKRSRWAYAKKWNEKFSQVESNCTVNSKTAFVKGARDPPQLIGLRTRKLIKYPLANGIPLSSSVFGNLSNLHANPFLWFIGQIEHFSLRLLPSEKRKLQADKKSTGFQSPIVGLHIRRTDKLDEEPGSFHSLEDYMIEAQKYFNEVHPGLKDRRVFVASEDATVLGEIRNKSASLEWTVIGFRSKTTTTNMNERVDSLDEVVRDVLLLSQCDFVVCGFTSNICRLAYELQQIRMWDASAATKSLDQEYFFHKIKPIVNLIS